MRPTPDTLLAIVSFWTLSPCLVGAIYFSAGSLNQEKQARTPGIVFLTGLGAPETVLGKLIGAAVHASQGLFAVIRVLPVTLLWGGLSMSEPSHQQADPAINAVRMKDTAP